MLSDKEDKSKFDDKKDPSKSDSEVTLYRPGMNFPLVKFCDMPDEMRIDSIETVSTELETALEKHPYNYENAAKAIKLQMDKKYGKSWHCIIGEAYGFFITYELKNLLYMFFNGNLAVLVFKGAQVFKKMKNQNIDDKPSS